MALLDWAAGSLGSAVTLPKERGGSDEDSRHGLLSPLVLCGRGQSDEMKEGERVGWKEKSVFDVRCEQLATPVFWIPCSLLGGLSPFSLTRTHDLNHG